MLRVFPLVVVLLAVALAAGCGLRFGRVPDERGDPANDVLSPPSTRPIARPDLDLRRVSVRTEDQRVVARFVASAPPGSALYLVDFRSKIGAAKRFSARTGPGGAIGVELRDVPSGSSPQGDRVWGHVTANTVTISIPRIAVGEYTDWLAEAQSTSPEPRDLIDTVPDRKRRVGGGGWPAP
ncbi:MAG: hypothetical protein ACR2H2_17610 [Solirubrobacteraceae bacterium]